MERSKREQISAVCAHFCADLVDEASSVQNVHLWIEVHIPTWHPFKFIHLQENVLIQSEMSASKMDVSQLESGVYVYVYAMETIKGEILQKKFIKE